MYEYHSWAVIRESPTDIDCGKLSNILTNIESYIKNLKWESGIITFHKLNGSVQLLSTGFSNHKTQEVSELFELFQYIANIAPGSYGIIYTWDDEDESGYNNSFRVHVLARGNVSTKEDPYLSPCVPVIEDSY
jgi:hypothetical protein